MNKRIPASWKHSMFLAFALLGGVCTQAQTPQFATKYKAGTTYEIFGHPPDSFSKRQNIYLQSDFNSIPSTGTITAIYFRVNYIWPSAPNPPSIPDFRIQMGLTQTDTFPNLQRPVPFLTGVTQVFQTANWTFSAPLSAGKWIKIPLQAPFYFNFGESNLLVEHSRGDMPGLDNSFTINDMGTSKLRSIIGRKKDPVAWYAGLQTITAIGLDLATTAVNEVTAPELHVYPNPASDRLFIANPLAEMKYRLMDVAGRVLQIGKVGEEGIDTRRLQPGMYLLRTESKGVMSTPTRFIKE